jgi:pimeloyl-ACP methyl ester carboxylesterase
MENAKIKNHKTSQKGFGNKGRGQYGATYAEMLLSGKPMGRRKSARTQTELKVCPKPKMHFGRKVDMTHPNKSMVFLPKVFKRRNWKTLTVWGVAAMLIVQVVSMIFAIPLPTLGGRQLWTDVRVAGGWRVQCHAWTGHCRLLDRHDFRQNWGREGEMLTAFDAVTAEGQVEASRPHAVVLVHGLGRSAHSLDKMAKTLGARGFEPVQFNYASTQGTIEDHAHALNRMLGDLKGVHTVSFVTHSLGGLVVRQALAFDEPTFEVGPVVMLAPPSQGSDFVRRLSGYAVFDFILGPSFTQLSNPAVQTLPALNGPFAVVAGNAAPISFVDGENDGFLRVDETKLAGASRHVVVQANHTFMMDDPDVIDFTVRFITANGS